MQTVPQTLRRIGIIGDIHGEDKLLAAALTFLQALPGLDALLCTGDLPGRNPGDKGNVGRCCRLLQRAGVQTVRGNHDRWFFADKGGRDDAPPGPPLSDSEREFLRTLPPTRTYQTTLGGLLLCHGVGTHDMEEIRPGDSEAIVSLSFPLHALHQDTATRLMVGGHTHRRMVRTFDHLTLINAGTLVAAHDPGFAVADFALRTVQFYNLYPGTVRIADAECFALPPL